MLKKISLMSLLKAECHSEIYRFHDMYFVKKCPFCGQEKAFMLVGNKYSCFSCGKGGNAIDFMMNIRKISFTNAVEYLAKKYECDIPPTVFEKQVVSEKQQKQLEINRLACRFYFNKLREPNNVGMKYFLDRGVSPHIATSFGLGYAGDFGDNLYQYLKKNNFSDDDILESGLVGKTKAPYDGGTKNFYDKYWGRVIFPILNPEGKVVAIGGRILGDGKPKYLNSPESPIFSKRENLFCYFAAKNSTKPYYIVCEGYMDAMSLHQYGFDSAVASLGTALTRDQIRMLSDKKIILAYDSDEAGVRATKRAIELCKEFNIPVTILQVKNAKDPDEFIKKFGAEEFEKLLQNAETSKHFLIRNSKLSNGLFNFDEAVNELV
jgi:DNA primase